MLIISLLPFFSGSSPYRQKRVQYQLFGDGPMSFLPLQFYFASLKAWMRALSEDEAKEVYLKGTPETLKLLSMKRIFNKELLTKIFHRSKYCIRRIHYFHKKLAPPISGIYLPTKQLPVKSQL